MGLKRVTEGRGLGGRATEEKDKDVGYADDDN